MRVKPETQRLIEYRSDSEHLLTIVFEDRLSPIDPDTHIPGEGEFDGRLLLSIEEAAHLLSIGRSAMYEHVISGEVKRVKHGRRRLVIRAGLQEFVNRLASEI